MPGKPVKSSPVWNYFTYPGTGKYANCTICKNTLSLGSEHPKNQTINSLKRHIERNHKDEWIVISKQLEPKSTSKRPRDENSESENNLNCRTKKARNELFERTLPQGQPSVSAWQKSCETWAFHDPRSQKIHKAIFEFMVTDMMPWDTVEGAGFLRMYKQTCPNFSVASESYYRNQLDPNYEKIKNKIKEKIESDNPDVFATTLDGWSECKNSYLGINIHYISDF